MAAATTPAVAHENTLVTPVNAYIVPAYKVIVLETAAVDIAHMPVSAYPATLNVILPPV